MAKFYSLSNTEIIELYKQGVSQKDISVKYSVSVDHIRTVLRKAGFSTSSFRATSDDIKQYIIALVIFGCTYVEIEEKSDISFHSIREIVINNDLKGASRKARLNKNSAEVSFSDYHRAFLTDYRNGNSFVSICKKHSFNSEQAIECFNLISKEDIEQHKKSLNNRINKLYSQGLSAASIGQILNISPSIVRRTLS